MNSIEINNILSAYPNLTSEGFEHNNTLKGRPINVKEVDKAIRWLKYNKTRESFNRRWTTYGLKHIAEKDQDTYIPNGAFICGAIGLGYKVKPIHNSPNAYINISSSLRGEKGDCRYGRR